MTAIPITWPRFFPDFHIASQSHDTPADNDLQDRKQELITRVISSGICTSELGAFALMDLFPEEF